MLPPEDLADLIHDAVRIATASLVERVKTLEARPIVMSMEPRDGRDGKDGIGLIGPEGPRGERGMDGAAGINGKDGVQGVSGKDGIDGRIGEQGRQGERGESGTDGKIGPIGPQGIAGIDGKNGADGINGKDGSRGSDGKDGISITDAFLRKDGHLALTFSDGAVRVIGNVVGADGQRGADGIQGADGSMGPQGSIGERGYQGEVGQRGPQGEKGADGINGKDAIFDRTEFDTLAMRVAGFSSALNRMDATIQALPVEVSPDELAQQFADLLKKELDAIVPPTRTQKRVIRDAHGRVDRVIEEPVL